MRPQYYWFRRRVGGRGYQGARGRCQPPTAVSAPRFPPPAAQADDHPLGSGGCFLSSRIEEAAARLHSGETHIGRIADLTGVPAALVEMMRDTTAAEASSPVARGGAPSRPAARGRGKTSMRRLMTVALLGASAFGCSMAAFITGRPVIAQLGAAASLLALLVAHRTCRLARRQLRRD